MILLNNLTENRVTSINLSAVIDTALCIGAGGSDGTLADKTVVRNAKGQLIIPASQLKGRLRHECEKIMQGLGWQIFFAPIAKELCPTPAQVDSKYHSDYKLENYKGYHCPISKIFGNPILPSRIVVDDLICDWEKDTLQETFRPGVTINRRRRTAENQKLYFLETSPPNSQLKFQGAIHLLPGYPSYAKALILAGLRHIHALGGSKSAGLGWLHWEELEKLPQDDSAWMQLLPKMSK
ncbi:MAG: CRISPR-associated protein Csm3 [Desmonostoc vinosum HA7617-LM4]|jgi:CRISPR/Cas system CSM-associated protein Csm3 (group 7 of RAMP superfamily)|nr:CRISPR-associated protein Csm3 [Desmonostoc vinosum HA7617-LM4]